jgi:BirA family transcriptional regulator, biotin operon repressor / biotin---[acetyl-CoA-carboxylase] ligase
VTAPPDLDAAAVANAADGRRIVGETLWLASCESTQVECRRRAQENGPGLLVVADEQTRGRGRWGRSWWSPPGQGLYLSLALAPERPRAEWAFLSALTALALREAIRDAGGPDCGIKWPNDILARGRKLAGILAEAGPEPWVVIGVGVNVAQAKSDFPGELRKRATSIAIERAQGALAIGRAAVLQAFLRALDHWVTRFASDGPAAGIEALCEASVLLGREVAISLVPGEPLTSGRVVDFGPGGEMILQPTEGPPGRVRVTSGEIVSIAPPLGE